MPTNRRRRSNPSEKVQSTFSESGFHLLRSWGLLSLAGTRLRPLLSFGFSQSYSSCFRYRHRTTPGVVDSTPDPGRPACDVDQHLLVSCHLVLIREGLLRSRMNWVQRGMTKPGFRQSLAGTTAPACVPVMLMRMSDTEPSTGKIVGAAPSEFMLPVPSVLLMTNRSISICRSTMMP
jgi:hypothetical protein